MPRKSKKGLKPFFIKYLALFIGICYIANPLHQEIGKVFHEISHVLEVPDKLVSHPTASNHGNDTHHYHKHYKLVVDHQHKLIDLINSILNASENDKPSKESLLTDIKFDKHITTRNYTIKKSLPTSVQANHGTPKNKIHIGHLEVLEKPPRNFLL
jgi:hypothetical protein